MSEPAKADQGDFDDAETARTAAPAKEKPAEKPRFLPRLVAAAEKYGISPEDIDACGSNQDLSLLIDHERREQASARRQSTGGGGDTSRTPSGRTAPTVTSPPPPPPVEEEIKFAHLDERDNYDPALTKELKAIIKRLNAAEKRGDDERVEELKRELSEARQEIRGLQAASDPIQIRANNYMAQFPKLFGAPVVNGRGSSRQDYNVRNIVQYVFEKDANGNEPHNTGNPERDIAAAMKFLGLSEPDAAPKPGANGHKRQVQSATDAWAESGQAEPTNRNGAARSGVPGGKKEAKKKVAEKMQEMGLEPGDIDDDPDDDEI